MAVNIGIIAEDDSDIAVVTTLIKKIARKKFKTKKFVGRGCGKIVAKCRNWAQDLHARGCTLLAIIHDLDEQHKATLYDSLCSALLPSPISRYVIVIPIKEIEAWLLADHAAINRAIKPRRPIGKVAAPQAVTNPKERLSELIYVHSDKRTTYVNSLHNARIAEHVSIGILRARCDSFVPFADFFQTHLT